MEFAVAILTGTLFAAGTYCLLQRSLMKLVIGIILLSQAANLLVFAAGGLARTAPVFAGSNGHVPSGHADPIPQALVLTAIVIGFGLVVFSISLLVRAYRAVGSDDVNAFNETDRIS